MAIPQNPNVYMETMEETENQGEEPAENGSAGRFVMAGRKQPERILVYHANGSGKYGKRKTDKQWLFDLAIAYQSVHRQPLKPPCTERYATR